MTHTHHSAHTERRPAIGPPAAEWCPKDTMTEYNDGPDKSPGKPDGGTVLNVSGEDTDSTMAEYPTRSARPITEHWLPDDDLAKIDVYAYDYDTEPGVVELCVGILGAHLSLTLDPEDASALADDLDDAAGRANDGG